MRALGLWEGLGLPVGVRKAADADSRSKSISIVPADRCFVSLRCRVGEYRIAAIVVAVTVFPRNTLGSSR